MTDGTSDQNRTVLGIICNTVNEANKTIAGKNSDSKSTSSSDSSKENDDIKASNSGKSKIGLRVPPLANTINSKLRPPKHTSTKPSMSNLEKKYVDVQSSGYGKIRSSSVPRSISSSNDEETKSLLYGAVKALSSSHNRTRPSSAPRHRRINSAPGSPSKTQKRSNSRIRSNSVTRAQNKRNGGTTAGSLWRQEQRALQQKRKEQHNQLNSNNRATAKTHKRTQSDRPFSYVDAVESPRKAMKTSKVDTPQSPKGTNNSDDSTSNMNAANKALKSRSAANTPIASIKNVLQNMTPTKLLKNKTANTPTAPIESPARSWSKSVEISSIASDYFDRKKFALATDLATFGSPSVQTTDIQTLVDEIFAPGTGLTDEEMRKVLNTKVPATKQWDLKKKVDLSNSLIKKLRDALNSYLQAKNRLVSSAIEKERKAKSTRNRVIHKAQLYEEENAVFKSKLKNLESKHDELNEKYKDTDRELLQTQEKLVGMGKELDSLRAKMAESEVTRTQAEINLAVLEGRCKEASKQADSWRAEIATIEASKSEAVKKASTSMERELIELREECAALRTKMQSREEELGRLVSFSFDNDDSSVSQLNRVKCELDRLRVRISELESIVIVKESEILRLTNERDAAVSRSNSKDSDMSELMKGLGDIQRSGQEREEKANSLRMAAEDKAAEMEVLLTEAKGKNSVLEHEKITLKENLDKCISDISSLEQNVTILKKEIQSHKEEYNSKETNLQVERELRGRAEAKEKEERNERIALSAQMVAMTKEHAQVEAHLKELNDSLERQWQEKLATEKERIALQEEELSTMKETIASLEGERDSVMEALNAKENMEKAQNVEEIGRLNGEINVLNRRLAEAEERAISSGQLSAEQIKSLQDQVREGQKERRKMHNIIQELRGNVRVFARVRPFLPGDGEDSDQEPCVVPKNENSLKIVLEGDKAKETNFSFDRVFAPSAGQESVFQEVSEFIQSALDGYNVCLFSYGQTGSGKTHTMQGSGVGQMRGIIPRAIEQVGKYKETLEKDGWKYEMKVSFLEIYNETIRDLLREDETEDVKHEIKMMSDGQRFISDLTIKVLEPTDSEAVQEVMRTAAKHRSVASTDMNAVSSRSHSVFTLHLTAKHSAQKQTLRGTLNLVDLAGSERLNRSGATGDRAKEAMSINKSLSSLTDVFTSIGKKSSHIPFRNSKLTYLLQPCLSGDGKTLMMVNLSPTIASYQESFCSLRFASQVNKCELGKPRRAIEDIDSDNESMKPKRHAPPNLAKRKKIRDGL